MSGIEERLRDLGLSLPAPTVIPPGVHLPFRLVNMRGTRVTISGHPMSNPDGTIGGPFGKFLSSKTDFTTLPVLE